MSVYNPQVFVPASTPPPDRRTLMVNELEQSLHVLSDRDQAFARSLIDNFRDRGLTPSQGDWVAILLDRVDQAKLPHPPRRSQQLAKGFTQIVTLFNRARDQGLRYPKIRLQTSSGQKIVLRMSSKGDVTVTDNGPSFHDRKYFGKINPEGLFSPTKLVTPDVTQLLKDLAENPTEMAALYGHQTSNCCFCGLELTTSESVTVGYGPICADNWGLPWGVKVQSTYVRLVP
jgi:hypothetical protein